MIFIGWVVANASAAVIVGFVRGAQARWAIGVLLAEALVINPIHPRYDPIFIAVRAGYIRARGQKLP